MNLHHIAERAERYNGRANRAAINRAFREADGSLLWHIYGRFNATERANQVRNCPAWSMLTDCQRGDIAPVGRV